MIPTLPERRISIRIEDAVLALITERTRVVAESFNSALRPVATQMAEVADRCSKAAESATEAFAQATRALREAGDLGDASRRFKAGAHMIDSSAEQLSDATKQTAEVILRVGELRNSFDQLIGHLHSSATALANSNKEATASLSAHIKTGTDDAITLNFLEKAVRMTYERLLAIGKTPRFSDLKWTLEHYPFENAMIEQIAHMLVLKLNRWTGEGVYSQLFDRETSSELGNTEDIICYDIDGLKESPDLQTAVAFTIARAVDQQIGRKDANGSLRPTIAVFDEVWAMLADPVLGTQVLNAFRTARKRYGSIVAASQGIEDFVGTAESPHTIGLAILQNTEAKFICAQLGELSRLRDVLHLSEPAIEAVKELRNVPGHFAESYLLVANQPESSTVIQLTATPFDYWATTSHPLETDFRDKFAKEHPELSALEIIYRLGMGHPKGTASAPPANRKGIYATAL